jgi:hypothetical protein
VQCSEILLHCIEWVKRLGFCKELKVSLYADRALLRLLFQLVEIDALCRHASKGDADTMGHQSEIVVSRPQPLAQPAVVARALVFKSVYVFVQPSE